MKDLTKGSPSRLILSFAIPIFFANLLQLTYSLVDTRIVGSFLGEDALAAVGATSTLSNLIIGFLLGLANGFAIITAQRSLPLRLYLSAQSAYHSHWKQLLSLNRQSGLTGVPFPDILCAEDSAIPLTGQRLPL